LTAIAKGAESFHRAAKVLDGQLKGKRFVTGDALTLADFSLGAPMNFADTARFPIGVLRRNQTLACASASVTGMAKDARAMRHTGRRCGLTRNRKR
jgi:glutathione S-transferase